MKIFLIHDLMRVNLMTGGYKIMNVSSMMFFYTPHNIYFNDYKQFSYFFKYSFSLGGASKQALGKCSNK